MAWNYDTCSCVMNLSCANCDPGDCCYMSGSDVTCYLCPSDCRTYVDPVNGSNCPNVGDCCGSNNPSAFRPIYSCNPSFCPPPPSDCRTTGCPYGTCCDSHNLEANPPIYSCDTSFCPTPTGNCHYDGCPAGLNCCYLGGGENGYQCLASCSGSSSSGACNKCNPFGTECEYCSGTCDPCIGCICGSSSSTSSGGVVCENNSDCSMRQYGTTTPPNGITCTCTIMPPFNLCACDMNAPD